MEMTVTQHDSREECCGCIAIGMLWTREVYANPLAILIMLGSVHRIVYNRFLNLNGTSGIRNNLFKLDFFLTPTYFPANGAVYAAPRGILFLTRLAELVDALDLKSSLRVAR